MYRYMLVAGSAQEELQSEMALAEVQEWRHLEMVLAQAHLEMVLAQAQEWLHLEVVLATDRWWGNDRKC